MLDFISTDKGWTVDECNQLTYRQVWFFWERYWHRQTIEIGKAVALSPFKAEKPKVIDGTKIENLVAAGIPVKLVSA